MKLSKNKKLWNCFKVDKYLKNWTFTALNTFTFYILLKSGQKQKQNTNEEIEINEEKRKQEKASSKLEKTRNFATEVDLISFEDKTKQKSFTNGSLSGQGELSFLFTIYDPINEIIVFKEWKSSVAGLDMHHQIQTVILLHLYNQKELLCLWKCLIPMLTSLSMWGRRLSAICWRQFIWNVHRSFLT